MTEAVIVATARTPIGRAFKGSLKDVRPDDLSVQVVRGLLDQLPALDPTTVDDLYWGCAEPSFKHGSNLARVVAVLAGMDHLPAATVNRFCASSTQTMRMAFHAIRAGEGDVFIAGGVECVSQYESFTGAGGSTGEAQNPRFAEAAQRTAQQAAANLPWSDPREEGQLPDVYLAMGQTAENVASLRGVSRERQDEWGVTSQNRAERAIADGFFEREILPVTLQDGSVVSRDDGPRAGVTLEGVRALQPVFREGGTVTAGNCCPLNDGASGVVVMSDTRARALGITPLARIVSTGVSALSPEIMGLGPVEASRQALDRAGLGVEDLDLYEINEAFAAQVLPSADDLGMDLERLNVHGGAIALGHPFGSTGTRIMTTLLNGLRSRDGHFGLETMCVGGGQGMAIVVERLS
ncbi:acetyl-CoA C-acetyltransferase [Phycicoccus endophyticus]|uniref:Acetyl-CoA C-acetyltransferase n=1 Tax=Phycicoccus endophyticus TaxID=1690220 RepID=A0A7G9R2H7_9MICO|nr:acetyl-CoA C-acetyltransferase [Phycicoccus endophyticus]NHI20741.1 acetyl-CoA C-acetyltransferase [Phycicoccus endophyticus]QNN49802.1 acetyl-CoA C-acetyltransferase [Phycicoccus endophyticus]GGL35250.1 acetyl-CoA acetyltransferase [Phycicoccus endophyticus]